VTGEEVLILKGKDGGFSGTESATGPRWAPRVDIQ
jgi:hypothetical protein